MPARTRTVLFWLALSGAMALPLVAAAFSPLLAWRDPVYIAAGFAGIVGLALMLLQPLLAGAALPALPPARSRRIHRWGGAALLCAIVLHVAGLWVTSPPDVVDVLLFRSPTPFSIWGNVAMWAVFAAALLAALRRRIRLRVWRAAHASLVSVAVLGSVGHALLIDGTMEMFSKIALCALVLAATFKTIAALRGWTRRA